MKQIIFYISYVLDRYLRLQTSTTKYFDSGANYSFPLLKHFMDPINKNNKILLYVTRNFDCVLFSF